MRTIAALLFLLSGSDSTSLLEAERAFARLSVEKGIKEAFLASLAEDGILFRPGPVPGKAWMRDRPAPVGRLSWEPARWEVSAAGDLGYTTGPWQFRAKGNDDPDVAHGHYITVWRRQADGVWKVAIDMGVSHAAGVHAVAPARRRPSAKATPADIEAARAALLARDQEFADTAKAKGLAAAYPAFLAEDPVVFRTDQPPRAGGDAAGAATATSEPPTWKPGRAEVSRSGDFGFTYGTAEGLAPFNYLRIWRKDGPSFRIVVDVTNPRPPSRPEH